MSEVCKRIPNMVFKLALLKQEKHFESGVPDTQQMKLHCLEYSLMGAHSQAFLLQLPTTEVLEKIYPELWQW